MQLNASSVVFLDTAPFIYSFEAHPRYGPVVARLLDDIYAASARMLTSVITYIELTTLPVREGQTRLAAKYRNYLTHSEQLTLLLIDLPVADQAVKLRAQYGLKTPDALQLASAIVNGADYILTNDKHWSKVTEIEVIQVRELESREA